MFDSNTLAENSAVTVAAAKAPKIPWRVVEVRALENYELFVRFADHTEGHVRMRELIFSERAGVFAALRDPGAFEQVGLDYGAVTWANGLDIAPDATYDDLREHGVQILR